MRLTLLKSEKYLSPNYLNPIIGFFFYYSINCFMHKLYFAVILISLVVTILNEVYNNALSKSNRHLFVTNHTSHKMDTINHAVIDDVNHMWLCHDKTYFKHMQTIKVNINLHIHTD